MSDELLDQDPVAVATWLALNGPHPDWQNYANLMRMKVYVSTWQFVEDAYTGTGGFATGQYLLWHKRELGKGVSIAPGVIPLNTTSAKYYHRQQLATYTNIAHEIASIPWYYIMQSRDLIRHQTDDPRLSDFWQNADGKGTNIVDFLNYPEIQARLHGTGIICVDRAPQEIINEQGNAATKPYAYAIPSKNLIFWKYDDDLDLEIAVVACPCQDKPFEESDIRVWTETKWADFSCSSSKSGLNYTLIATGDNLLGEIPLIFLYNERPEPGKAFGRTEMLDVCRLAWEVYNKESELREQERNTAFNFLAIPMKDVNSIDVDKMVIGTESLLTYDGNSGKPEWIAPHVDLLKYYQDAINSKIAQAYSIARLKAITEILAAKSGYQAEIETQQTTSKLSMISSQVEDAEVRISRLVLRYYGVKDPEAALAFKIVYPREFGIRDKDKLIARTDLLLSLNFGKVANKRFIKDLFSSLYPRDSADEIESLATLAANALPQNSPDTQTAQTRIKRLLTVQALPTNVLQ